MCRCSYYILTVCIQTHVAKPLQQWKCVMKHSSGLGKNLIGKPHHLVYKIDYKAQDHAYIHKVNRS